MQTRYTIENFSGAVAGELPFTAGFAADSSATRMSASKSPVCQKFHEGGEGRGVCGGKGEEEDTGGGGQVQQGTPAA